MEKAAECHENARECARHADESTTERLFSRLHKGRGKERSWSARKANTAVSPVTVLILTTGQLIADIINRANGRPSKPLLVLHVPV